MDENRLALDRVESISALSAHSAVKGLMSAYIYFFGILSIHYRGLPLHAKVLHFKLTGEA